MNKKRIIYIIVVAVLALTTITLSVLLFTKDEKKDNSYYDNKCLSFAFQNTNLSKGQIIFVGDSITDLYPLDDYYNELELATYNRGIGGDTTLGLEARLKVSIFDLKPSVVVLLIGINDINGGRSVSDIAETYRKILDSIKKELPNTKVYCISVLPMNKDIEEYSHIKADMGNQKVNELNLQIKNLTNEFEVTYVDLYSKVVDNDNYLNKNYSDDGIHLNSNGFIVWTNEMIKYLQ